MRCAISLTMGSLNVRAMSACSSQHLTLSVVPLPTFPSAGQSAVPSNVIIQPLGGIQTPFAPRPPSSSPPSSHPAFRSPTESFSPIMPPTLSYVPGSYVPPPGPPTTYPPPSGTQPPAPTFQGPENIIIMPLPPTAVSGQMPGQQHILIPGASTSQLTPRPRSRSQTSDIAISVPPQASRYTPAVLVPDAPHSRYPSRHHRTRDEAGSRSRSLSPVIHIPPSSHGRSRPQSGRRRSSSPIIITRSQSRSRSTSSGRRGRTQQIIIPPPIVPPSIAGPVLQVSPSRSRSDSPRSGMHDDRTREPGRRTRSRDHPRFRLFKPRRSRDRTPPIIIAPPPPGISAQAPAPQAPFFVPPTAPPAPIIVEQPFSAAPISPPRSPPRSRPRSRGHAPTFVLPPSEPRERYRDRDRYRHPDDRYEGRYGPRRGPPMDDPYRRHSPSARYRPSRPHSRSYSPQYRRDPPRRRRYSPSYSSDYDSRSRSPSPHGYPSHSGEPWSSRGYPRSSRRPPRRDYDASSSPPVTFGPEPRPHSVSDSTPIVIRPPSRVPPESRGPTLVTRSRGRSRSRSRSPFTIVQEATHEQPLTFVHDDTQLPTTYSPSVHVIPVSQSALRR